ncbi:hypothetical protein E3U23_00935 [Erythrobacter litoralis]|uniref:hypothetical protein n=1 Tax=Erythrobacter litoralis TaxID=39960 RepID=UPI002434BF97|nr:hypothetical protein [Erythrobacter litoralis]MDG6077763.1 hypothetical protein [Erythrobacter litoralis]
MALLFLGLNELLDLQTVLTATGRSLAREQGWYRERRSFQLWFMVIFSIAALLGAALVLWKLRNALWPVRLAMIGFVAIAIYVVLRAASFHHTDQLLRGGLELVKFGSLLEMGGIAVVAISAVTYKRLAEKSV